MNHVDRSDAFAATHRLVTDRPGTRTAPPAPPEVNLSDDDFVPDGLRAWAGRVTNGFYVQGLVAADGTVFLSAGIPGRSLHQTWEVARKDAADAFDHPFAYGCTLPL